MGWLDLLSITIAGFALLISGWTMWWTHFRRGKIKMTQPEMAAFLYENGNHRSPKIFLRTLLYSTAERGQVIEGLFVRIHNSEVSQTFHRWFYVDQHLVPGSGLFVGKNGISTNHHFAPSATLENFNFWAGDCELDVFARLVGRRSLVRLARISLSMTDAEAERLKVADVTALFIRNPDTGEYETHIDERPPRLPRQVSAPDDLYATAYRK